MLRYIFNLFSYVFTELMHTSISVRLKFREQFIMVWNNHYFGQIYSVVEAKWLSFLDEIFYCFKKSSTTPCHTKRNASWHNFTFFHFSVCRSLFYHFFFSMLSVLLVCFRVKRWLNIWQDRKTICHKPLGLRVNQLTADFSGRSALKDLTGILWYLTVRLLGLLGKELTNQNVTLSERSFFSNLTQNIEESQFEIKKNPTKCKLLRTAQ